mgnify:CR=1 FL=1
MANKLEPMTFDRLIEAFYAHVEPLGHDDCWEWTGRRNQRGYGLYEFERQNKRTRWKAHRLSFFIHFGPIPDWADVMHACDNEPCSNPFHLGLGTTADNNQDMARKGRVRNQHSGVTHCKRSHEFTAENTTIDKYGRRYCRACRRLRHQLEYYPLPGLLEATP